MTQGSASDAMARLKDVLHTERDLLLTGRAAQTAALVEEKSALLGAVEARLQTAGTAQLTPGERQGLEALVAQARENAVHFAAVRNGLAGAIARLDTLHDNAWVGSYGERGAPVPFSGAAGQYRKKV